MVRYPENDEDPGGTEGDEEAEPHGEEAGVEGVEGHGVEEGAHQEHHQEGDALGRGISDT